MRTQLFAALCLAAILPWLSSNAIAQVSRPNRALESAIDKLVAERGVSPDSPGVAILVRQSNKVLFKKGYGLANLDDAAPITPKTMFELASLSKPFTATAVLILHERGKLSLDDDVRTYLPELPQYAETPITIRDLLQHVSGLPSYFDLVDVPKANGEYWVNLDFLGQFAKQQAAFPLGFPTGSKHEYNNTNYLLAALIVERVSKQTYGEFLREAIFKPAGMKNTFVHDSRDAAPKKPAQGCINSIGYLKSEENGEWLASWGLPPSRREEHLEVGDGAIWSNLEDLALWDAAIRRGKLLKRETMKLALTPSKTADGVTNNYGLGWSVYPDESGGLNGFGHDGSWAGFRTSYYNYLAGDRTTVILSNRGDFDVDGFWYALNDAIAAHAPDR